MASLSMARRRQAWLDGVVCGATKQGRCELSVPKLKEIYERGVVFGRDNAESPAVRAAVATKQRRQAPKAPQRAPQQRYRGRPTNSSRPARGNEGPRFNQRPERRGF
jgi:hypothetical protein